MNALPADSHCATLVSRVEVDPDDPAFATPSKPIGPVYKAEEAARVAEELGWSMVTEATGGLRRVVPSPLPLRILGLQAIEGLLKAGHIVICAGGGGIPVIRDENGHINGVEAVIDKDRTAALLATDLGADALLLLTDVSAVIRNFGRDDQTAIGATTPDALDALDLPPGSMGPKVQAAASFVRLSGKLAGIGQLTDARAILESSVEMSVRPDLTAPRGLAETRQKTSGFVGHNQPVSVWLDDGGANVRSVHRASVHVYPSD